MQRRKRSVVSAAIPTASMADIAFLLIIFFLVTTSMARDKGLGLTLPQSGALTRVPSRSITTVWINSIGEIAHDGQMVSLEELGRRVGSMTIENPNLIVSIKTAPDARYEVFVQVIDEIKKAGNDKISIAEPEI
jgi:biopolymer transport protein ExbD